MDVRRDDRGYVRCGGTGVARLVRTRLAAERRPALLRNKCRQAPSPLRTSLREEHCRVNAVLLLV